jgi:hypothetical protein
MCESNCGTTRPYSMLDVVFYGDRESRDKFNIVLSEMINPKMNADLYLDSAEHESEIKQVIGDTYSAHNLSEDDILIVGNLCITLLDSVFRSVQCHNIHLGCFIVRPFRSALPSSLIGVSV